MKSTLTKTQYNYIIDCIIEEIAQKYTEENNVSVSKALSTIYSSTTYKKIIDTNTGLYLMSPMYIYERMKQESTTTRN